MDPAIVSAMSALLGSLIGGSASVASTWTNQRLLNRRELLLRELRRRETLYGDFITECSKLMIDSLDHSLDNISTMVSAYTLFNRIRLTSSASVIGAADAVLKGLIDRFLRTNLTIEQIRNLIVERHAMTNDPLAEFSLACRAELEALRLADPTDFRQPVAATSRLASVG